MLPFMSMAAMPGGADPGPAFATPSVVGAFAFYNGSGNNLTDYQLTFSDFPGYTAAEDDLIIVNNPRLNSGTPTAPSGAEVLNTESRLSTTVGENWNWGVWGLRLTGTDISNGYVLIPHLGNVTAVGAVAIRNAAANIIGSYDLDNANVSHRPSGLSYNSIALQQRAPVTAAPDAIALALVARGGGLLTSTFPAGWTSRFDSMDPSTTAAGRVAVHGMTLVVNANSPAATFSVSGSAVNNLATKTFIIEGKAL